MKAMKKLITIFTLIFSFAGTAFADKSRFYENGKVLDTMYVDSPEGLRVRDKPSLKSNRLCGLPHRLCGLPHRLPVKVVAIGKETTIDGITAPWVEILLPRYEWKGSEAEFGWVFGGYLAGEQPDFTKPPKTAKELQDYLSSIDAWDEYENNENHYYIFSFGKDGSFWHGKDGSGIGEGGTWKAISKDTVQFHTSFVMEYGEDSSWELTFVFEKDGSFHYDTSDGANYCYPARRASEWTYYASNCMGNLMDWYIWYYEVYLKELEGWQEREKARHIRELIQSGVSAKGTGYEWRYHDYWNPIMAEHQKKADEMK